MEASKYIDNVISESSLSRLYKHMKEHDSGTVTAYRSEYTNEENKKRNYVLSAKIAHKRYQITEVDGVYIENFESKDPKKPPIEVKERVFFVVDANDTGDLEKELIKWGEEGLNGDGSDSQDSIMFIPKGGAKGILIGTSHRESGYPPYGIKKEYPDAVWGKPGQFMTKIHGRPYFFNENVEGKELVLPEGYFGRYGCYAVSTMPWRNLY